MRRLLTFLIASLMMAASAEAAIAITYKAGVWSTTNTTGAFTAAPTWTPAANSLLMCFVVTTYSATPSDPSSVAGHGVAGGYTKLTLGTSTLSTTHQLSVWVAKAGASPTSAACVTTQTTTNGTGTAVIEAEVTGADVSGTAAQAIVLSNATGTATSTAEAVTLATPSSINNRPIIFSVQLSNTAQTQSGSWTLGSGATPNFNTPATGANIAWRTDVFDTAGAMTGANVAYRAVGMEIKAATPATPTGHPVFIQEAETDWNDSTIGVATKTTASFNVVAGDVLVAFAVAEEFSNGANGSGTLTITGGSLVWVENQTIRTSAFTSVTLATALVDTTKSMTATVTRSDTSDANGFGVNVLTFRNSVGAGASSKENGTDAGSGTEPSLNLTTNLNKSLIVVVNGEWLGVTTPARAARTGAGTFTEVTFDFNAGSDVTYGGYYGNPGNAGTYAVGWSAPVGQKYAIAAVEVYGGATADPTGRGILLGGKRNKLVRTP